MTLKPPRVQQTETPVAHKTAGGFAGYGAISPAPTFASGIHAKP